MKNYTDYTFIIDVDGTLCPIKEKNQNYEDLVPYFDIVAKIKFLHDNGAKIILFTSRNMKTYSGNIGLINKYTAKTMEKWLDKWNIPYDEIIFGKPWPGPKGYYVDDRTLRPDEFLNNEVEDFDDVCSNKRFNKI